MKKKKKKKKQKTPRKLHIKIFPWDILGQR